MRAGRAFAVVSWLAGSLVVWGGVGPRAEATPRAPKEPAKIDVTVQPRTAAPGSEVRVRLQLAPVPGVKINRYPKIRLTVPAQEGLVGAAEAETGSDTPPPPDRLDTNYYRTVDPVEVTLKLDSAAAPGDHRVPASVRYFYCVTASGFCAPAKVAVEIPLSIRSR
jgi:hypothetical protein